MNGAIGITGQVVFDDTSGSGDVSAVQVDAESSFMAENTSFVGFGRKARAGYQCI